LFRRDLFIRGTHATKLTELKFFQGIEVEETEGSKLLFPRYIDVYMVAPLVGAIYGKKEPLCNKEQLQRRIPAETVNKYYDRLSTVYELILLFDNYNELSLEDRVYRAFRDHANRDHNDNHQNNKELFNSYLRGGISVLHEKITKDTRLYEDYLNNYYNFIMEFKRDFIDKKDYFDEIEVKFDIV